MVHYLVQVDTHTHGVMYARKDMHEYKEYTSIYTENKNRNKARVGNAMCKTLTLSLYCGLVHAIFSISATFLCCIPLSDFVNKAGSPSVVEGCSSGTTVCMLRLINKITL